MCLLSVRVRMSVRVIFLPLVATVRISLTALQNMRQRRSTHNLHILQLKEKNEKERFRVRLTGLQDVAEMAHL